MVFVVTSGSTFHNLDTFWVLTGKLELIHYDVCGTMPSISLSGYEYYVTIIDDYSRKTWIYFFNTKSEVFGKYKEFKPLIENHSERRIKTLRSYNGG